MRAYCQHIFRWVVNAMSNYKVKDTMHRWFLVFMADWFYDVQSLFFKHYHFYAKIVLMYAPSIISAHSCPSWIWSLFFSIFKIHNSTSSLHSRYWLQPSFKSLSTNWNFCAFPSFCYAVSKWFVFDKLPVICCNIRDFFLLSERLFSMKNKRIFPISLQIWRFFLNKKNVLTKIE